MAYDTFATSSLIGGLSEPDHWLVILLAKSKSGERYHKKGHYSLLGGEYQPPWLLEKNRKSLRKSNSPTLS